MNILDQLADYARERVARDKAQVTLETLKAQALALPVGAFAFEQALAKPDLSFICECKKASPSKGLIAPEFPYLDIARAYEFAGADAISVLTEPKWFLGSDQYLQDIAAAVDIPCLRKDFTVDEYMIYQAKVLGASAVLLICSLLKEGEIRDSIALCDTLGLSALVEAHDEDEVKKLKKELDELKQENEELKAKLSAVPQSGATPVNMSESKVLSREELLKQYATLSPTEKTLFWRKHKEQLTAH